MVSRSQKSARFVLALFVFAAANGLTSNAFSQPNAVRVEDDAKHGVCGTELTPADVAAFSSRGPLEIPTALRASQPPYFVPIAPHIVRQNDGSGGMPESQYQQALNDINAHFAPAQIQFYSIGPIDYIDSTVLYNATSLLKINALRNTNVVPNAVNVYFTGVLSNQGTSLCGISSFTTSSTQGIVMKNSCTAVLGNHSSFSHEMGHYFDLLHTHETQFGEELVDGTNCASTGDFVCDTPADPKLDTITVDPTCVYTGTVVDANLELYQPDTRLLMSFSRKDCRNFFTAESATRMVATLLSSRAGLLTNVTSTPLQDARVRAISLSEPHPNPASESVEIRYQLTRPSRVTASVFDVRGALVRELSGEVAVSAFGTIRWDARDSSGRAVAPGSYFVRIQALGESAMKRVLVLK